MTDLNYSDYKIFSFDSVISEEKFNSYARFAMDYVNYITCDRLKNVEDIPEQVKKAAYAIINEKVKIENEKQKGIITSEKVGDYSVSFTTSIDTRTTEGKRLYRIAKMYLAHTGLLYRGV